MLSSRNLMCLAVSWLNTTVWRLNTKVSSFKGTHFFDGFSGHFHGIFSYGKGVGVWSDTNFITRTGRKVLPCNFFCLNLTPTMMETSRSMAHLRDMQFSIGFHDYLRLKGTEIWGPFSLLFWYWSLHESCRNQQTSWTSSQQIFNFSLRFGQILVNETT